MIEGFGNVEEVPAAFAKRLLSSVEELGYPSLDLLESAGVTREELDCKDKHITSAQQTAIIQTILTKVDTPGLGLISGRDVSILDWGALGYAYVSSATLRQALDIFVRFQRLNGPMVNNYLREEGDEAKISAKENYPLGDVHQFAIEDWLSETRNGIARFGVPDISFNSVSLTYPEPAHSDLYRELYDCPILFDQEANEICFPKKFLDTPFDLADEAVAELCIRKCADVLKHLSEEDPVVDAVRRVLLSNPGITPTLEVVSGFLHMSARTLRRRLSEANTSYKDVLSDVRLGLAAEYLRTTRMAPKEIAYLMGYSGVTSFHRAFKRRFDLTPSEYRGSAEED
ncbi:AraC family transcriptional regulator [Luminiphilus sp.]|nr:AraC family transcriptional regulator [Luminiphilus sp.]MDB3923418.1 AraC family transcriptional regulator [Luminiphilus sp.]